MKDMFCVIQEVEVKTVPAGEPKRIEVYESRWTADGKECCSYEYRNSAERFERPIRKSYRISIHESYRENGKVRKKQTVICTIRALSKAFHPDSNPDKDTSEEMKMLNRLKSDWGV